MTTGAADWNRVHCATASDSQRHVSAPILFVTALAGAALLRFSGLGRQPLWLDEATTASFAERCLRGAIFAETSHPPLYNVLLHFIVRAFGSSESTLRLLPSLFGIAAVWAAWGVARHLVPRAALPVVLLTATSPFLIYFSQENRNYSLFIFLSLVATWSFLHVGETGRGLPFYVVLSILLLYTHYFGAFVLLAHEFVFWGGRRQPGAWAAGSRADTGVHLYGERTLGAQKWLLARGVVVLAFLPWAGWVFLHSPPEMREWIGTAWLRAPYAWLRFLLGYGIAARDLRVEPLSILVREESAVVVPALLLLLWLAVRGWGSLSDGKTKALFAAILFLPFLILIPLSPWMRLVHERYLAFQAPFVLMLVALGLESLAPRVRVVGASACAGIVALSLTAYYEAPGSLLGYRFRYAKEDWPGVAAYLQTMRPDTIVLAPGYLHLPLDRYLPASLGCRHVQAREGYDPIADLGGAQRIALILSRAGSAEEQLRERLEASHNRAAEKTFFPQNVIRVIVYDAPGKEAENRNLKSDTHRGSPSFPEAGAPPVQPR